MIEKRYIISDAAKLVEVETHVLRYWEEELDIEIPRNEMGHRFYTDYYINIFKKIRELKEGGFQLKAIKMLVPEIMEKEKTGGADVDVLKNELFQKDSKLEQFQDIMNSALSNAFNDNKEEFGRCVSDIVSDNVTKEIDYLMQLREKQEEERFKKLDETIRMYQNTGKERVKKNRFWQKKKG